MKLYHENLTLPYFDTKYYSYVCWASKTLIHYKRKHVSKIESALQNLSSSTTDIYHCSRAFISPAHFFDFGFSWKIGGIKSTTYIILFFQTLTVSHTDHQLVFIVNTVLMHWAWEMPFVSTTTNCQYCSIFVTNNDS